MRRILLIASAMLAAVAVGCNGSSNPDTGGNDTAPQDATDTGSGDTGHDAGDVHDAAPMNFFIPCASTHDCASLGSRAMCVTAYPGGVCTTTCSTDRNCGS